MADTSLACCQCGADLKYDPKATALACPYCGTENEIAKEPDDVGEQDFRAFLKQSQKSEDTYEVNTAKCSTCGAESSVAENFQSGPCPFCGDTITGAQSAHRLIKPQSILPFKVDRDKARAQFRAWIKGLWFAPSSIKKMENGAERLQGIYLPHWTYDTDCSSSYVGQRGIHYWVSESYSTTDAKGNRVTRTRRVRKTRWYPAAGKVFNSFDDILVVASQSLPIKYVEKLEPWDLTNLAKFDEKYVQGFTTESYSVGLEDGFARAAEKAKPEIERSIRHDIGGDAQRILNYHTGYQKITFKHLLLPVWLSSYRHHKKAYRFVVNARTGETIGERPWSAWKIGLAIAAVVAVIAAIVIANQ